MGLSWKDSRAGIRVLKALAADGNDRPASKILDMLGIWQYPGMELEDFLNHVADALEKVNRSFL